jgi:molecular chaperone DnaJ
MEERRDLYEVLGVAKTATAEEIRKAYRQAALKHHPDRNSGDAGAAARFKEATEAFQVLSDDEKRAVYDQYGFAGIESGGGFPGGVDLGDIFGNFQDLFSEFFGGGPGRSRARSGPKRGPDIRIGERLSMREAAFGCKREIALRYPAPCQECHGTGAAAGTQPIACTNCRGSGHVSNARGFVMFTAPCPACRGEGKVIKTPCSECHGSGQREKSKKIVVAFPPGIDEGQVLRVPGQGIPGPAGAGDVLVQIEIEQEAGFERHGADLATKVKVPLTDAILGAKVNVPTLDDEPLEIDLPAGTQTGHVVQVRGRGVPRLEGKGRGGRGALHVVIEVEIPSGGALSARAKKLIEDLREELSADAKPEAKAARG